MARPPDKATDEHRATVCLPCPDCGNIIPSFTVQRPSHGDTTVLTAKCDQCLWHEEASVLTDDLGLTSLALPTNYGRLSAGAELRLDALYEMAPGAAPDGEAADDLDELIDAAEDRHPVLDSPIFTARAVAPAPKKPTQRPDVDDDGLCVSLDEIAGLPPTLDSLAAPVRRPPTASIVRRSSTGTVRRLRQKRRRGEAWLLSIACLVALAMGGLELIFLAHRMTTPQIILVAVFLVPVTVFLVRGMKGLWRDTQPA